MVGHMWRFDADTNYIKETVASGKLGTVIKTKGYGIHENWGPSGWFVQKSLAGGGALADMGVHAIDTVRYILGDPNPTKVYARISTRFGDYDVDDTGILIITWDNGTESIIESGWWQSHMDGPEASTGVFGTKGYASLFPTFLKMKKGESSEKIVPELPTREEHCDQVIYTRQMEHFIESIQTRQPPSPGLMEGQIVLDIVDAAYESSRTGEVVNQNRRGGKSLIQHIVLVRNYPRQDLLAGYHPPTFHPLTLSRTSPSDLKTAEIVRCSPGSRLR